VQRTADKIGVAAISVPNIGRRRQVSFVETFYLPSSYFSSLLVSVEVESFQRGRRYS